MEDSFEVDLVTCLRENRKMEDVCHIQCEHENDGIRGNINQIMIQKKLKIIEDY